MQGVSKLSRLARSADAIRLVGLAGQEQSSIQDLSGGMKQRVAIARTLVTNPAILLMDEPFSALDAQNRELLQDELLRIQEEKKMTILFVTHNIDEAIILSDRILVLGGSTGIRAVIPVQLDRPRIEEMRVSTEFLEYKKILMQELRIESQAVRT